MNTLSQRIANLSPAKRHLLLQRMGAAPHLMAPGADDLSITPVPRPAHIPLSFMQQRLWLLDQLMPGNVAYNIPAALRFIGPLNCTALNEALSAVVRRHETLRTIFTNVYGQAAQIIAAPQPVHIPIIDLSALSAAEREAEAQRLAGAEAGRSFDLATGPLFRVTLLKLAEQDYVLLATMHHIISDGWSSNVLTKEVLTLYESSVMSEPPRLPDLPIQYADFAIWQRERLRGGALERQRTYWLKQLAGAPVLLELPTDRPRPAAQSHRGASESLMLEPQLCAALKQLSRAQGATLFMTLLAAYQTLLYRYTGQDQVCVGTPVTNRARTELEGLIGFFVNTLVMRGDLSGDPGFCELLRRVRETALQAYAHQDLPFETLIEALQPERSLSHTPLFQVMFNLGAFSAPRVELRDLTVIPLATRENSSKVDLALHASERGDQIQLTLVYTAALFDPASIERMLRHLQTLLEGIVANPERRISAFPLVSQAEWEQQSGAAHRAAVRPQAPFIEFIRSEIEQSISQRFEQQAQAHPDKLAVKTRNHAWSYRHLSELADRLAETIWRRPHAAENIAMLFDHDATMIAAILGALKAGKTYVPLVPSYPPAWLAHILSDAQATALITDNAHLALARQVARADLPLINIDCLDDASGATHGRVPVRPDSIAYLLYTSGSTRQPKGVIQNHRNALQHIRNYTNQLRLNAADRLTLFSTYAFDAAVMDIFGALLNGAALYPINLKEERPNEIVDWLASERITVFHSTPTVYRHLATHLTGAEDISSIRLVVLGGEEASRRDFEMFRAHFPPECILINGFGPTESTLALQHFMNADTQLTSNAVLVGHPVADTHILLLNEAGEEVADVGQGEIAISSDHIALGYWRQPELTAAAFLPDPHDKGQRIYRTGDLGRRLPDGSLAFIGRKDTQVKIRGHRIETSAIETALCEHPDVRGGAVIADGDQSQEKRLVAYVVMRQASAGGIKELHRFLREKLPDYMLPAMIVPLEDLPLTANGKVDRRALPAPDRARLLLTETFAAPRTPMEETLAGLWRELLDLERVGVYDNFFDLGGHSLMATRLLARVRDTCQIELPLRRLFESPTIASLAEIIEQSIERRATLPSPAIVPRERASRRMNLSAAGTPPKR